MPRIPGSFDLDFTGGHTGLQSLHNGYPVRAPSDQDGVTNFVVFSFKITKSAVCPLRCVVWCQWSSPVLRGTAVVPDDPNHPTELPESRAVPRGSRGAVFS